MKVILDCDLMKHPHSGLYHYCLNLGIEIDELLKEENAGSISFYVPPAEKDAFGKDARIILDRNNFWNFLRPFKLDCDLWHAPFQSGRIVPTKKPNGFPKILLTIHDLNQLHEGKPLEEQQKSVAHIQSLIDRSDAMVCISEFCRQDVLAHCDVGHKPVYVIHNGMHKVGEPRLNGISYRPGRPFLFGLGYVNTKKNYHVLLPLLENESIELIVAGRLDEEAYITRMKEMAEQMGVGERLQIIGPISEHEKAWYFENCMAFVHPSLAEGFGAPVVEAMQFGKPLFLSNLTSLPEIASSTAFYFNSFEADHMQTVFYEGLKRYQNENMIDIIKKRGENFNWKEKAKQYLNVYREVLA